MGVGVRAWGMCMCMCMSMCMCMCMGMCMGVCVARAAAGHGRAWLWMAALLLRWHAHIGGRERERGWRAHGAHRHTFEAECAAERVRKSVQQSTWWE